MLDPILAVIGLGGGEIILLFLALLVVPVMIAAVVVLVVWLVRRGDRQNPPPARPVPPTKRVCQGCGKEISADAPQGLCPACLMNVALGSEGGNPAYFSERKPAPPAADIAGSFPQLEILELLGQGGMGMVYKARQPQLDRVVALKILSPELSRDPAFAERFNREARALARLNHPNIVGVFDFGKAGEFYYFIMEYVDGMNLWQMERGKKRLAPEEALAIVPKICDALQYAHDEGIVHRDIKPGNILLDKKGRVKIADFGLAKLVGKHRDNFSITQSRMTLGTPQYMAPEQFEDAQNVDHRADIYSLGVVFYEMLTGELPMGRFAPPSQKVQVDVRLDEVVLRTLEKEPGRRYQHASQVKSDVESLSGVIEKLPPHLRHAFGYEFRSKQTLFGLPLVHINNGVDLDTGKARVARGIIAIGGKAEGVFAFGGVARGVFAFGGLAVGLVAVGGLAIGLVGLGGLAIGLLLAYGGGAIGGIAVGGGAVGYYAMGGGAWGVHAMGSNAHDPAAKAFFESWGKMWVNYVVWSLCLLAPAVGGLVPAWLQHRAQRGQGATQKNHGWLFLFAAILPLLILVFVVGIWSISSKRRAESQQAASGQLQIELSNEIGRHLNERKIYYEQIIFPPASNWPGAIVTLTRLSGDTATYGIGQPMKARLLLRLKPESCEVTGIENINIHFSFPIATRGRGWWPESNVGAGDFPESAELRAAKARLAEMQQQYTENHPQVQALRRRIGELEQLSARTPVSSGELEFRLVAAEGDTGTPADELAEPGDRTGQQKMRVLKEVLLDSSAVASASLEAAQPQSDVKTISVMLKSNAVQRISDITATNVGRRLAIVWRGRVLSAPTIQSKISGPAVSVTGTLTDAESLVLLDLLNYKPDKVPSLEKP